MMEKVTIKKPCYQDLSCMPRIPGGVWCTRCGEKVEDLTDVKEADLLEWLKKNKETKPCGIYNEKQATIPITQKLIRPFRYAAATAAAFFIRSEVHPQAASVPHDDSVAMKMYNDSLHHEFSGTVYSRKSGKPLPGVDVYVSDKDSVILTVKTDESGNFRCELPPNDSPYYEVSFSMYGYDSQYFENYYPCGSTFDVLLEKRTHKQMRYRRVVSKF